MSASPPMISMSDKEDSHIQEHEVTNERAKHMKEEWQRQWEEEAKRQQRPRRLRERQRLKRPRER